MSWLILRILLVVLLIWLIRRLMARVLAAFLAALRGAPSQTRSRAASADQKRVVKGTMVRDPNCGTYVASELAIAARSGGQTFHFCSQECREEFIRQRG